MVNGDPPQPSLTERGTGQTSIAPEQNPIPVPSTRQHVRDQAVHPHRSLSGPDEHLDLKQGWI